MNNDSSAERQRRLPAAQRRKMITDATLRCLADRSVDKVSIRDICAEAGISIGLISYYYDGKEALIADAYAQIATRLQGALQHEVEQTAGGPRLRLSAFIRASFLPVNLDADLMHAWLSFWSMSRRRGRIAEVHDRTYGAYRRLLERLIADAAHVDNASKLDVRLAAVGVSALLDGLWVEWCLNPETFTPEEGIRVCEACVDALLWDGVGHGAGEARSCDAS